MRPTSARSSKPTRGGSTREWRIGSRLRSIPRRDRARISNEERAMGEIVAAVGTCHTPYMFTRPPDEQPEQLDQAAAGMAELGRVLDETRPDVIIFLGSDHVETFSVTCIPSFAIIAGSRAIA